MGKAERKRDAIRANARLLLLLEIEKITGKPVDIDAISGVSLAQLRAIVVRLRS